MRNRLKSIAFLRKRPPTAFSLIELLVVIAIVSILIALAVPTINATLKSLHLNAATQVVVDQLNFARQTATSRQVPVEVRFYKLPDYDLPAGNAPTVYRAIQTFIYDDTNVVAVTKSEYFPASVVISSNVNESSLFEGTLISENSGTNAIANYGMNYRYRSIYFKPSGSMNLQGTNIFFTLVQEGGKSVSQGANFSTVQIDGKTGRVNIYRP